MTETLERLRGRLTDRQRLAAGIAVTVAACALAYVLGVLALLAYFDDLDDFDHPTGRGEGLGRFLGAVALVTFVASGPAGYVISRNRALLWTPAVLVAVPLAIWGVYGVFN